MVELATDLQTSGSLSVAARGTRAKSLARKAICIPRASTQRTTRSFPMLLVEAVSAYEHPGASSVVMLTIAQFWTCTAGNTFLGCCKANPCSTGICSNANLEPAALNRDDLRSAYGVIGGSSSSSTRLSTVVTSTTSTYSTTGISTSTLATATRDASAATAAPKEGPPVGAIAGGAAGGALGVAAVVGLLIYLFCHAKKSRKGHQDSVIDPQSDVPAMMDTQSKDGAMMSPGSECLYGHSSTRSY
jgi:hypothetical protein